MDQFMDPYYLSQKEVNIGISDMKSKLADRDDMLNDPRGGNHEIFKAIGMKITDSLATVRGLLHDMSATIDQVRANPGQFKISDGEIANREHFIEQSLQELNVIENQLTVQSSNQRSLFHASPFQPVAPVAANSAEPTQAQLFAHQEEQINAIGDQVEQQKLIGMEIINAINDDQRRLAEMDEQITSANEAMKSVTRRIMTLIENEGKTPTYLVAILSVVLVLMLFWVA